MPLSPQAAATAAMETGSLYQVGTAVPPPPGVENLVVQVDRVAGEAEQVVARTRSRCSGASLIAKGANTDSVTK